MKRLSKESLLVFLLIFSTCSPLVAEEKPPYCEDEACFPSTVAPFGLILKRASKARYRYYGFLVFDSSLYTESPEVLKTDFLGKVPYALRLCYHRTMNADDFRRSAVKTLALNPDADMLKLHSAIELLHPKYTEVGEGDCYQLSFKPGTGTELSLNDKPVVLVPGDEFARYYFGIWLSKFSFSESLTENLLTPLAN